MITTQSNKGLNESPLLFGIKGRYIMYMITIFVIEAIITVFAMIITFFSKKFGAGFTSVLMGLISFIMTALIFRYISIEKDYKHIKQRPEIISNQNLIDYID
jgi:magnesium-transporting ATPase (P-type)